MTLKNRLYLTCGFALFVVLLSGGVSLYFMDTFGSEIKKLVGDNLAGFNILFEQAQRNLLLIFVIIIVSAIALIVIAPYRAVLPLRRFFLAFREAETGNLSVRLSADSDEKMDELASAFNALVGQMEELDDKRVKKIAFEQRKFETLSNLLDYAVFICNVEGQVLFVNSQVYRAFNLSSIQLVGVPLEEAALPKDLIRLISEAVTRKERVEDMPWELTYKKDETDIRCPLIVDIYPIATHAGEVVNMIIMLEERDKPRAERIFQREEKKEIT